MTAAADEDDENGDEKPGERGDDTVCNNSTTLGTTTSKIIAFGEGRGYEANGVQILILKSETKKNAQTRTKEGN